jgi:hypothetical protein
LYSRRIGEVKRVSRQSAKCEILEVLCEGRICRAYNFIPLTGPATAGDRIVINTTAVELNLGSGGYHFVCLNLNNPERSSRGQGHIMKLRYTPLQLRVRAVEEETSPYHAVMKEADNISGMPVIAAELHSMLAPFALALKKKLPKVRLAYVMTDGGALPAFFSRTLAVLKARELICGTVTTGHAFGGDLEAVNVYSGLLAARHVLKADAAVASMGPGVVGTGTRFGFSGLEMGENLNRAAVLGGRPVALPRLSFADRRARHRGISHHTLTALLKAALVSADVPLPLLGEAENAVICEQLAAGGLVEKHKFFRYYVAPDFFCGEESLCNTMGRGLKSDPAFFAAAAACALHTAAVLEKQG